MVETDENPIFVYTTVETEQQAEVLGEALVSARLAACVNIIPGIRSIYHWQGRLEKSREYALLIKSNKHRVEELLITAKQLHPYDLPALLTLPIAGGDGDYLAWASGELTSHPGSKTD